MTSRKADGASRGLRTPLGQVMVAGGRWIQEVHAASAGPLPYQLFVPCHESSETLPLVIFLHGTGEAGTDNAKQLLAGTGIGPDYFCAPSRQQRQPCYVLAPQTPESIRWASTAPAEYDLEATPMTSSMAALLSLIDVLRDRLPIDRSRIYIGGMSRGEQGAWNACFHRPGLFAAAYVCCGSGSPRHARLIKDIPFWVFHGDADPVTSVEYSRNMVRALRPLVSEARRLKYTEIPKGGHDSAWHKAHRGEALHDWLLRRRSRDVKPSA